MNHTHTHTHTHTHARTHIRTVVRECCNKDDASQWKIPKSDVTPNPLNQSSPKLARAIMSWMTLDTWNFAAIGSGCFCSQNTWRAHGASTSKDVVPVKDVLLGVPITKSNTYRLHPFCGNKPQSGDIFWLHIFCDNTPPLTWASSPINYPNHHRSPRKVL